MKERYAVYRNRTLILDPKTKKDAIFTSKKEAYALMSALNEHSAGFFVGIVPETVKVKGVKS